MTNNKPKVKVHAPKYPCGLAIKVERRMRRAGYFKGWEIKMPGMLQPMEWVARPGESITCKRCAKYVAKKNGKGVNNG